MWRWLSGCWQKGLTMSDLRRIVEEATPGPWTKPESSNHMVVLQQRPHIGYRRQAWFTEPDGWQAKADSEFIATFDPVLVAALLDVVDELREHGHYETCDWVLRFDASCSCPMAALDRLDALTPEKEQTDG
jgi:hypothetical protein